jgi:hypothetical protein
MSIVELLNFTPNDIVRRIFLSESDDITNKDKDQDQRLAQPKRQPWTVPFSISRWLCLTSTSFVIPGYYAYVNGLSLFSLVNLVTVLASLWHWSNAREDSLARAVDIAWCKINFTIYFVAGCTFSRELWIWLVGLSGLVWGAYTFFRSSYLHTDKTWYLWHGSFHLSVVAQQMLVLYAMVQQDAHLYLYQPF